MAKIRLACDNCGFEEELGGKKLKERQGEDGVIACSACGAALSLPYEPTGAESRPKKKTGKKPKYAGPDDMTGLDDVIDGEIVASDMPEEAKDDTARPDAAGAYASEPEAPKASVYNAAPGEAPKAEEAPGGARNMAGAAREKLRHTVRHGRENPLFVAEIIDSLFRKITAGGHGCFDGVSAASVRIGHYVLLRTAALGALMGLLISLRSLSLTPLLSGLALAATLLFAQYLALRGFDLLEGYIEKNPSRLPGPALPEMFSAVAVLLALLAFLSGLTLTVSYSSPVWLGLSALGVIAGYFAAAAFMECQERLNVTFDRSLPASEVIVELIATGLKAVAAVTPFVFGLGGAAMALCMIWPVTSMLLFSLTQVNTAGFLLQETGLLFCAFAPILSYLFILFWTFIIQVARGLLALKK